VGVCVVDLPILWEDAALVAVNKPAGLRAIPDGYDPTLPHLHGLLSAQYGRLWVVHRLDKDTSGVMILARSAAAHRSLSLQFEQRETRKEYHALVCGAPDWEEREIDLPLRVNGDRKHRTVIDAAGGRAAFTFCRVLRRWGAFTLLAVYPRTGYTHQIRAHLAAVGLPIAADPLYAALARPAPPPPIQRTALHAFQIHFTHPIQAAPMTLQAPYPADLEEAIGRLGA